MFICEVKVQFHITVSIFSWTGKAGEKVSKFRIGGHLMRDQTVGSNSREGGAWPGKQGKLGIAIDWVTDRLTLNSFRVGSMYSQAHISLYNNYWRVWLLVISGGWKGTPGKRGGFLQLQVKSTFLTYPHQVHLIQRHLPKCCDLFCPLPLFKLPSSTCLWATVARLLLPRQRCPEKGHISCNWPKIRGRTRIQLLERVAKSTQHRVLQSSSYSNPTCRKRMKAERVPA